MARTEKDHARVREMMARQALQSLERERDAARDRDNLEAWWGDLDLRRRVLSALECVTGLSRHEILSRLGARNTVAELNFKRPPEHVRKREKLLLHGPRRPRGRPRREIDRAAVVAALRAEAGSVRAAAMRLGAPRNTIARYVERERLPDVHGYAAEINDAHAELLARGGVAPMVAAARGYRSAKDGLTIPVCTVGGTAWTQVRLDRPENNRKRYRNQRGFWAVVDVPPAGRDLARDRTRTLYVTESPRKADAAVSRGLACVAVVGVELLCLDDAQWNSIGVRGREVVIAFDADAATNPRVTAAEQKLRAYLAKLGADVRAARIPPVADNPKTGLDDYLAAGMAVGELAYVE